MSDWIKKLKEYAPHIAGAVLSGGATLPALAVKAVSDAIGVDVKDESALADIVTDASPDAMLKIKQADNAFKIRMRELDVELGAAELRNQEHAREQHKHSPMPAIIACALTVIIAGMLYAVFELTIPVENSEVAYYLFGQVTTLWAASITYWVGTTRSSAEKDRYKKAP